MEQDVLRKVQLTQLEIAKEIRRVCQENNIAYFMVDGTFLGAVRHQGFIPWDDDMDFGMLRKDYEEFCRIAPEKLKPEYFLQTWYSDPGYALPFAKVRKRGTLFLEAKSRRLQENGFFVDIFPLDYAPADSDAQQAMKRKLLQLYRVKLMKSRYTPWMEEKRIVWKKRIGYLYYQMKALFADPVQLAREFDALASSVECSDFVWEQCDIAHDRPCPVFLLTELADFSFEGELFAGPRDYDAYLTNNYGNYMQLPPEDQRQNRHQVEGLDFGENAAEK